MIAAKALAAAAARKIAAIKRPAGAATIVIVSLVIDAVAASQTPPKSSPSRELPSVRNVSKKVPDLSKYGTVELRELVTRLYERVYELENKTAAERLKKLEAENEKLVKENERLRRQLETRKPSDSRGPSDGREEVTSAQLEVLGEKYVGKQVRITGCRFDGADNAFVRLLPFVRIPYVGSRDVSLEVSAKLCEGWIGFGVVDKDNVSFRYCFAGKPNYGVLVAGLKRGTKVNLRGVVIKLEGVTGQYGLICDEIEVVD